MFPARLMLSVRPPQAEHNRMEAEYCRSCVVESTTVCIITFYYGIAQSGTLCVVKVNVNVLEM